MSPLVQPSLPPAGMAFDAIAEGFDDRFGQWLSVAAQRRAVHEELIRAFPRGSQLLEIGGGTGVDAAWLTARNRSVLLTDVSPAMVRVAARKLGENAVATIAAEQLDLVNRDGHKFDGAFSNFAALNCVSDLRPIGASLAQLIRPGGRVVLVFFGCCCPAEIVIETARGRFGNTLRRFRRGDVPAKIGENRFSVRYYSRRDVSAALAPWFKATASRAIGLFVPPSAAEPWISAYPRLLAVLEAIDRRLSRTLAPLGDHVLYVFERLAEE